MVAAGSADKPVERRELVTRMVPPGEVIHITGESEDGERGRQVVTVWREPKETSGATMI